MFLFLKTFLKKLKFKQQKGFWTRVNRVNCTWDEKRAVLGCTEEALEA